MHRAVSELSFRRGTVDDAARVTALAVEGFDVYRAFAPPGWSGPSREEEEPRVATALARASTWCEIAEDATALVGHVAWLPAAEARKPVDDPATAHLWQLFVRRDWWGTGLATRLHAAGLRAAAERAFTTMRLWTPAAHGRARRFYEREGWRLHGAPFDDAAFGMQLAEYRREL